MRKGNTEEMTQHSALILKHLAPRLVALVLTVEVMLLASGCSIAPAATPSAPDDPITIVDFSELLSINCPTLNGSNMVKFQNAAREAEGKFNVNHRLILAVVTVESRCSHRARSPVGATGAMQLMPKTALWLGVKNPHSIKENVRGGTKYLAQLLEEFDYDLELALAAYNAGPTNVRKFGGVPPFPETQQFVSRVLDCYYDYLAAV